MSINLPTYQQIRFFKFFIRLGFSFSFCLSPVKFDQTENWNCFEIVDFVLVISDPIVVSLIPCSLLSSFFVKVL